MQLKNQQLITALRELRVRHLDLKARKDPSRATKGGQLQGQDKQISWAGASFGIVHELFVLERVLDIPRPESANFLDASFRYNSDYNKDLAAIAELYHYLSADLQAALANDDRRPSFKKLVCLLFLYTAFAA
jgi:hypothetical protein